VNYYQRFLGDYARDTRHLSLMAHGAYSLLLDAYYATERPLPADLDSLCRICGAINPPERAAVETIADKFFQVAQDGLRHNKRADIEIAKALPRIATARANGLRGGRPVETRDEPAGLGDGYPAGSQDEPSGKTALHQHQSSTSTPTPKVKNTVGLKPDAAQVNSERRKQAAEIIAFLNEKAGKGFEPKGANLDFVIARLKDGETVDDCRAIIAMKVREWTGDPKASKWLRPETLFNRTKFASYKGELGPKAAA
jgi:uncharacterized phage protein (TIGR02220 family)